MRKCFLAVFVATLLSSCSSLPSYPRRACLYDTHGNYREGEIIYKRPTDGAQLFAFKDLAEGDHGTIWITDGSPFLRQCSAPDTLQQHDPQQQQPDGFPQHDPFNRGGGQ